MLLSDLKWSVGEYWNEAHIGRHSVFLCKRNGGHHHTGHCAGEYVFVANARDGWGSHILEGRGDRRDYERLDPLTAQALLFHYLGSNPSEPDVPTEQPKHKETT